MEYIEIQIEGLDPAISELLTAALFELGYDSFAEENGQFMAYIPFPDYDEDQLRAVLKSSFPGTEMRLISRRLEERNWNEEWERNYEPVLIQGKCLIRAPFHSPVPGVQYDLVIEPKMSFGTAHHETTSMMIGWLLDEPATGKHVLDIGCGTAVLAILAAKMGAKEVRAVDNDEWAFANAKENCLRNNVPQVHVIHGSDGSIPSGPYDIIMANINRNILMDQMSIYSRVTGAGGILYMSGFYAEDLDAITQKASEYGIHFVSSREKNRWIAAKFRK
jgi:ribosomal protein L11 methyltransferase